MRHTTRGGGWTRRCGAALAAAALLAWAAPAARAQDDCPSAVPGAYETGGSPTSNQIVDDPLFPRQWGLWQISAPRAWAGGFSGRGVVVATLDTGVDLRHPELARRLLPGEDLVPLAAGNCADGPQDDHGHGTHVAGIIAANANNGIGVAGVAPRVKILPIKVCGANGSCRQRHVARGLRAAADAGADVINVSLGYDLVQRTDDPDDAELHAAARYAWQRGAVLVAAAGNSAEPLCVSPASLPNWICVAATDRRGLPAEYSNLPFDTDEVVGLQAPGGRLVGGISPLAPLGSCDEAVLSLWVSFTGASSCIARGFRFVPGTSMAAPHVSGVAALLAEAGLTNEQIVARLAATASNAGRNDPVRGYGIVDAAAATAGLTPLPADD